MVNQRQARPPDPGVLRAPHALSRLDDKPTGLQIEPILALLRVAVAVVYAPVIVEVIAAVARLRVNDFRNKKVQQFVQSQSYPSVPRDAIERCQRLHQTQMPVV